MNGREYMAEKWKKLDIGTNFAKTSNVVVVAGNQVNADRTHKRSKPASR